MLKKNGKPVSYKTKADLDAEASDAAAAKFNANPKNRVQSDTSSSLSDGEMKRKMSASTRENNDDYKKRYTDAAFTSAKLPMMPDKNKYQKKDGTVIRGATVKKK